MVVNVPKSLSIAAALHPDVSAALDDAQGDAVREIRTWPGQHSVTRIGPRGAQRVVHADRLQTVAVSHRTSRAGDPHRHVHLQIGTRVWAEGAWRALDTAALFRQQGAVRALGTGILAAHPQLAAILDRHRLTLDPITGEVAELVPWNHVMSKRAAQVTRNLAMFEREWITAHPGQEPSAEVRARLQARAWDHQRPHKRPSVLSTDAAWRAEMRVAGCPTQPPRARNIAPTVALDDLSVEVVASRALDRCAATSSAWSVHDVREQVARIVTSLGCRTDPAALRAFIELAAGLALQDCLSVLPVDAPTPEHVAHLTTARVMAVETALRDKLAEMADASHRATAPLIDDDRRDADQVSAARAVASTAPLVVVEGAAGAGKTTMLGAAIDAATTVDRRVRILTPTRKAAQVATTELGVRATSVAAFLHEHGFRWNDDGVWTRLPVGDRDPETDGAYLGPPSDARLVRGERIVVDESGMLDQDSAHALLTVAHKAGATIALVGDRVQLPAVGRGGVLEIAATLVPAVHDLTALHRFADPDYARLTLALRAGVDADALFDRLHAAGLVRIHGDEDALRDGVALEHHHGVALTTATMAEASALNARIRDRRVERGQVDDKTTAVGSDGMPIGRGDVIQTRKNDSTLRVANRQTWLVDKVLPGGTIAVVSNVLERGRRARVILPSDYVASNAHLAYASTAYGMQGVTAGESQTVLSDAATAASLYVGLTRGRDRNRLHIVAENLADAKGQFAEAMERDRADRGLEEAARRAAERIRGLINGLPAPTVPQRDADAHACRAEALRRGPLGGFDRDAARRRSDRGGGLAIGR
ncbi:AAA family ATPase [Microbacterium hominis]|uniref:AAA family ATPase n=1 Tax=Microbacterium hominis TaxID=162426 RepID=UPI0020B89623|nr:AAA family ATPase [Microbacterium hominis]